ncbi:MAG: class I SAM-dependent methyltransferase [Chloroflexota bacterium]
MPSSVARFLLKRGWFIKPGSETSAPEESANRYKDNLEKAGVSINGSDLMIFGYGGHFDTACVLLKMGAKHVTLCELDTPPDHDNNAALLPVYADYLRKDGNLILPKDRHISLLQGDIRKLAAEKSLEKCDLVVSISVYEHLQDVPGITRALAGITKPGGVHLHLVDLRDHFFKYPFEMLCYSEKIWAGWLNPASHHNRYRFGDYQKVFEELFKEVEIEVLSRDLEAFKKSKARIRPEFLTGDPQVDSITSIKIFARKAD